MLHSEHSSKHILCLMDLILFKFSATFAPFVLFGVRWFQQSTFANEADVQYNLKQLESIRSWLPLQLSILYLQYGDVRLSWHWWLVMIITSNSFFSLGLHKNSYSKLKSSFSQEFFFPHTTNEDYTVQENHYSIWYRFE